MALASREFHQNREGEVFISDDVSMVMNTLFNKAAKNYWGVFEVEKDSYTGRKKIWNPLTAISVDTILKNTNIDLGDIKVDAKNPSQFATATITRYLLRDYLDKINFGWTIDQIRKVAAIFGVSPVKVVDKYSEKYKRTMRDIVLIDPRNLILDQSNQSVRNAPSFIERSLYTIDQVKDKEEWINTQYVKGSEVIQTFHDLGQPQTSEVPYVEIFERWGKIPKYFITGKEKDRQEWVMGHIVIANLDKQSVLLKLEEWTEEVLYDECKINEWYGRHAGEGIPERLFGLQEYANQIINTRKNTNEILQNGLFIAEKGCGVTPADIARLRAGGVVILNEGKMDKFKEMQNRNFAQDQSIADEEHIMSLAEKRTFTFDVARGETMPATQSATSAMIQSNSAKSANEQIVEETSRFISRIIENHILPFLPKFYTDKEIIKLAIPADELDEINEKILENKFNDAMVEYILDTGGLTPDPMMQEAALNKSRKEIKKVRDGIFYQFSKGMNVTDLTVNVSVNDELLDRNALAQNLLMGITQLAQVNPELDVQYMTKQLFDALGLDPDRSHKPKAMTQPMPQQPGMAPITPQAPQTPTGQQPVPNPQMV